MECARYALFAVPSRRTVARANELLNCTPSYDPFVDEDFAGVSEVLWEGFINVLL